MRYSGQLKGAAKTRTLLCGSIFVMIAQDASTAKAWSSVKLDSKTTLPAVSKTRLNPTSKNAVQINLGDWDMNADVEPTLFRRLVKASKGSRANEFFLSWEYQCGVYIQYRYLYNRARKTLLYGRRYSNTDKEIPPIYAFYPVTDAKIQAVVSRRTGHVDDLTLFGCAKTRIK